jgi:hypothetical protein
LKPVSDKWRVACHRMMGGQLTDGQKPVSEWWLSSDSRFCCILGGERGGKSNLAARLALFSTDIHSTGEYWIVGPDYQQARPEFMYMYNALQDGLEGIGFIKPESVSMPVSIASPWSFETIWGQVFRTRSAADIQKLASFSVSGVLMVEAAQQVYEAYLKLMARIQETRGFLILSGTLERGLPWYGDLYTRWLGENELGARSFSLPTWSNNIVFPGGREDKGIKELESEYPPDLFMERFGAVPSRKLGLVVPEFDYAKHVRRLEVDTNLPVELAIDPGQHCYAVLFLQFDGPVTNVLDAVYTHGQIAQNVIPQVVANKYFQYVDPARAGVIDNAGKQHMANKSQVELWQEIAGCSLRAHYWQLEDTIASVRFRLLDGNMWHKPLIYFNNHFGNRKSPDGLALDILAEFELWSWPDREPTRNVAKTPVDRNNDAIKALAYALLDRYGVNTKEKKLKRTTRRQYFI